MAIRAIIQLIYLNWSKGIKKGFYENTKYAYIGKVKQVHFDLARSFGFESCYNITQLPVKVIL